MKTQYLVAILIALFWISCDKEQIKDPEEINVNNSSVQLHDSTVVIFNKHLNNLGAGEENMIWDDQSGVMTISKDAVVQMDYQFVENGIFVCDLDTTGILRRILTIDSTSNNYIITTEEATFEDFFSDLDIDLSTEASDEVLESSMVDHEDISEALTDEDGILHPFKIIDYDQEGNVLSTWSAYEPTNLNSVSFNLTYNYSGATLMDYKKEHVEAKLFVTDGSINFSNKTVISISLKTKWSGIIPHTYINTFVFSNNSKLVMNTDLKLQTNAAFEYKKTTNLKKLFNKKYCYMVGVVPVWITVKADLFSYVDVQAGGCVEATSGLKYTLDKCNFGVKYNHSDGWSAIRDISHSIDKKPLKVVGNDSVVSIAEIYPRMEVDLYGIAGPYAEIVPYLKNYNHFNFDYTLGGEKNTYWYSQFQTGLVSRFGAKVKVLGHTLAEYHKNYTLISPLTLYQAPDKIQIISGNDQSGTKSQDLTSNITVKVLDSWGNVVDKAPVYFEPLSINDGSPAHRLQFTDSQGLGSTQWKLGTNASQSMKVSLKKSKTADISSVTFKATAK